MRQFRGRIRLAYLAQHAVFYDEGLFAGEIVPALGAGADGGVVIQPEVIAMIVGFQPFGEQGGIFCHSREGLFGMDAEIGVRSAAAQ